MSTRLERGMRLVVGRMRLVAGGDEAGRCGLKGWPCGRMQLAVEGYTYSRSGWITKVGHPERLDVGGGTNGRGRRKGYMLRE